MPTTTVLRLAGGSALHASGAGPPLLFLHGVAGGAWSWAPQTAAFAATHRCYVWEARGHGLAARVEDAGLGDYYCDAGEALAWIAAREEAPWVVGHSMGGLLALALGAERPAAVRGLALLEPVYAPDGGRHSGGAVARALVGPLVRSVGRNGRLARALARRMFVASFDDREARERAWRRQRTQVPLEYPKMMYEAFEGPSDFPNRAFAREVDRPTLLLEGSVAGRGPRFPHLVDDLGHLGERFAYRIVEGGHYLQLDRSASRVTDALGEFVARWSR